MRVALYVARDEREVEFINRRENIREVISVGELVGRRLGYGFLKPAGNGRVALYLGFWRKKRIALTKRYEFVLFDPKTMRVVPPDRYSPLVIPTRYILNWEQIYKDPDVAILVSLDRNFNPVDPPAQGFSATEEEVRVWRRRFANLATVFNMLQMRYNELYERYQVVKENYATLRMMYQRTVASLEEADRRILEYQAQMEGAFRKLEQMGALLTQLYNTIRVMRDSYMKAIDTLLSVLGRSSEAEANLVARQLDSLKNWMETVYDLVQQMRATVVIPEQTVKMYTKLEQLGTKIEEVGKSFERLEMRLREIGLTPPPKAKEEEKSLEEVAKEVKKELKGE